MRKIKYGARTTKFGSRTTNFGVKKLILMMIKIKFGGNPLVMVY
jgi:hypothetical protein